MKNVKDGQRDQETEKKFRFETTKFFSRTELAENRVFENVKVYRDVSGV